MKSENKETEEGDLDLEISESRRYEIGCLLLPTIPAESVAESFGKLVAEITSSFGIKVIGSTDPKSIHLAYSISKALEHKNIKFKEAYFASFSFSVLPDKILEINDFLRAHPIILRFLTVILPPEVKEDRGRWRSDRPAPDSSETLPSSPAKLDAAEVDREIDGLLASATTL